MRVVGGVKWVEWGWGEVLDACGVYAMGSGELGALCWF